MSGVRAVVIETQTTNNKSTAHVSLDLVAVKINQTGDCEG